MFTGCIVFCFFFFPLPIFLSKTRCSHFLFFISPFTANNESQTIHITRTLKSFPPLLPANKPDSPRAILSPPHTRVVFFFSFFFFLHTSHYDTYNHPRLFCATLFGGNCRAGGRGESTDGGHGQFLVGCSAPAEPDTSGMQREASFALICLSLYIDGAICHPATLWLRRDV